MTDCELGPTVVGSAFHALEPDEEARVDEHLAGCDTCRQALDEALEVAAVLAAAVPQLDPPAHLRQRVLTAARAEPHPSRTPTIEVVLADDLPGDDGPAPLPTGTPARRRSRRALAVVAAAAVLGVGLLGVRAVVPTESGPDGGQPTLAERAQQVVNGAEAREPGTRHATLRSGDGQPVAVVLDEAAGARVVPLAMSAPAGGQRYVLWAAGRDATVAVATVDTVDGATVPLPGTVRPALPRAYAMSVEPAGPVPARPSAVMAIGALV